MTRPGGLNARKAGVTRQVERAEAAPRAPGVQRWELWLTERDNRRLARRIAKERGRVRK